MPSWQDEYLGALHERDRYEKGSQIVFENYTRLADRTATLQNAIPSENPGHQPEANTASTTPQDPKASRSRTVPGSPILDGGLVKIRQELSDAQRSRGLMETRLQSVTEELRRLKVQSGLDTKKIEELTKEGAVLTRGMKDRDEELKGKTKLMDDIHDETVSLTLQLNMADERSQKLEKENKELVARWMKRMAQEADAMNDKSKFS